MSFIGQIKRVKIIKSNYIRNVLVLVGGTGFAQVISFFLTPVLTRLYAPSEYGIFGLFTMIVIVLGILPTLELHNIIIIEKDDTYAKKATGVVFFISLTITFLLFLIFLIIKDYLVIQLNIQGYENLILLVPLIIFINSVYLLLMSWANRKAKFKLMAQNRIMLALINPIITILLSYLTKSANGLIIGYIIGNFFVTILLLYIFIIKEKLNFRFCIKDIGQVIFNYKDFPKFSLPSSLVNAVINQIPLLILNRYSNTSSVGQFNLSNRTLGMPISIISSSFNEVFKQRATQTYNKYGKCDKIFVKSFFSLLVVSLFIFSVFALFGSDVFALVFGEQWRIAGKYSSIMVPLFVMRFSVSPLTYLFVIANKQKYDLWGHIGMLVLITISFPISSFFSDDSSALIAGYTVAYCIVYLFFLVKSYHFSRGKKNVVI